MKAHPIKLLLAIFVLTGFLLKPDALAAQQAPPGTRNLPVEVDNSKAPWFPPIYSQQWFPNCQQAAGVYYAFTYAVNRLRGDTANTDNHIMATNFTYNFYDGESQDGVSFLHSYQLIAEAGNPTREDFGNDHLVGGLYWMDGYDKYYRAMHNRVDKIFSIPLNTVEGLHTMRGWLHDHNDGSEWGGVAVFSAHSVYAYKFLPPESPHAGKVVMTSFYTTPSHGMCIVGYNDSIRYDINEDGKFTNNLDINGDGRIDLGDWEIGGYIVVNSYGTAFANDGFFYLMYSAFAQGQNNWGGQNECAWAVTVKKDYKPELTARFNISHNLRDRISLKIGLSSDTARRYPEFVREYQIFNQQGNPHVMNGDDNDPNGERLEAGLDLTPLLSRMESGKPFRIFLIIDQKIMADGAAKGKLHSFDVLTDSQIFTSPDREISLDGKAQTLVSVVVFAPETDKPRITNPELPPYTAGSPFEQQLLAEGGRPPYTFSAETEYQYFDDQTDYPVEPLQPLEVLNTRTRLVAVPLPFVFPFYNTNYQTIYVSDNGTINFDSTSYPYSYIRDAKAYLKDRRCIAGAYSMSGIYHRPEDDQLFADIRDDQAIFRWTVVSKLTGDTLQPAVRIFPSGKVEIFRPAFTGSHPDKAWYGISAGDGDNFHLRTYDQTPLDKNYHTAYLPSLPPVGWKLSETGVLTFEPDSDSLSFTITAKVTDHAGISGLKQLTLHSGLTAETNAIQAGADTVFRLFVALHNHSLTGYQNLGIKLKCRHPGVNLIQWQANLVQLPAGETRTIEDDLLLSINNNLENNACIVLEIEIEAEGLQKTIFSTVRIGRPELRLVQAVVNDGHNNRLDRGETAELEITLANTGIAGLEGVRWLLHSADTNLRVMNTAWSANTDIDAGAYDMHRFWVAAGRHATEGQTYALALHVDDAKGFSRVLSIPVQVGATPVLILDVAKQSPSRDTLTKYLNQLNVSHRVLKTTTIDYTSKAIFLLTGTNPNGYNLKAEEANRFADYLKNGGNLYLEGYQYWHYGTASRLNKYMGYTTTTGPVQMYDKLKGFAGNFLAGANGQLMSGMYMAIFYLQMVGNSTPLFESDYPGPQTIIYTKDSTYKVIGSIPEIGNISMYAPYNTRELVKAYCHFFGLDTSGLFALFHGTNRRIQAGDTVYFNDDSFDGITTRHWQFDGGTPAWSTEKKPAVSYENPGIYDVTLTIGNGISSRSLTRNGYVIVTGSSGYTEKPKENDKLIIFPNPVSETAWICSPFTGGETEIAVYDLNGRIIRTFNTPGVGLLSIQATGLEPGAYIVVLRQGNHLARGMMMKIR